MATYQKGSLQLDYNYTKGEEGKPTVVLIHGFGIDQRIWKAQVEHLTSKGYGVLTYDVRGFGKSSIPDSPYTHHDDLNDLLESEELDLKEVHLVGMSFGGEVAIDMTLEHSDKVKSLTLLGASVGGYKADPESPLSDWMTLKKKGEDEKITKEMLEHESLSHLSSADREFVGKQLKDYSLWHLDGNDTRRFLNPPAMERLGEINCPVSVMVGEKDSEHQKEIANLLEREVPNSTLSVLEGTGHFINVEAADQFNDWLDEGLSNEFRVEQEAEKDAEEKAGVSMV